MSKPAIARLTGLARLMPARMRHGRPGILAARILGASALAGITLHAGVGPAPAAGTLTGIATWLAVTTGRDIAPPPGR